MLLEAAAVAVTGWLEAGKGEWCYDLCGDLTDDSATGGPLGELKASTGQAYPSLEAKRQAVVDAWRGFQRAWPWGKDAAKATYETKAQEFASALEAEIMVTASVPALGAGDFLEQLKGISLIVWVAIVGLLVGGVALVAFRK